MKKLLFISILFFVSQLFSKSLNSEDYVLKIFKIENDGRKVEIESYDFDEWNIATSGVFKNTIKYFKYEEKHIKFELYNNAAKENGFYKIGHYLESNENVVFYIRVNEKLFCFIVEHDGHKNSTPSKDKVDENNSKHNKNGVEINLNKKSKNNLSNKISLNVFEIDKKRKSTFVKSFPIKDTNVDFDGFFNENLEIIEVNNYYIKIRVKTDNGVFDVQTNLYDLDVNKKQESFAEFLINGKFYSLSFSKE